MSIRLRFTLLFSTILALTLTVFSLALYSIQSQSTLDALKKDIEQSSNTLGTSVLEALLNYLPSSAQVSGSNTHPPLSFMLFSSEGQLLDIPEREIVRILDSKGNLLASPYGRVEDVLPLSKDGLAALQNKQNWWQTATSQGQNVLIYNRPVVVNGKVVYILQVARSLTEREISLKTLSTTLIFADLVTLLVAVGIGWIFSGVTLRPIHRITQTAKVIGEEQDFDRRVEHKGPQDEVGQLANTFNAMLARLQDSYQRVAHSLEMQRNFVADVSHELRTPLTTLRGNLELLRRTPPISEPDRADIMNDMVDESDRLIRLVNELLLLARADAGRNLAHEPIIVRPVLEEVCRQVQQIDPARSITLEASSELALLGDRDALKQVLLILLDNALKHTAGAIEVSAARLGDLVELRVQDHGEGIPPDKLAHVFDRFFRGNGANSETGLGLGLSIARSLVEAQSGSIRIESEMGKGSVVVFSLPAAN